MELFSLTQVQLLVTLYPALNTHFCEYKIYISSLGEKCIKSCKSNLPVGCVLYIKVKN